HCLTLGVQLHSRRLMRGDVLRQFSLEVECANAALAQRTVDPGELPPALSRKVDGYRIACRNETVDGIKHKGGLPQKISGRTLALDAGRASSAVSSASLRRA